MGETPALAFQFYVDAGGGLSKLSTPAGLTSGTATELAVLFPFTHPSSQIGLHFGAMHRTSSATSGATYYGLQAIYPVIRLEALRVFITGGATAVTLWSRARGNAGFDGFKRVSGFAAYGEAGYEHPITPEISIIASAFGEFYSAGSPDGLASQTSISGLLGFRLFYGAPAPSSGPPRGLEGWRYPFGLEKKK